MPAARQVHQGDEGLQDKLMVELERVYDDRVPRRLEGILKEGKTKLDDRDHILRIVDELGWGSMREFIKDVWARNKQEEILG
jgi:hypothetical protein